MGQCLSWAFLAAQTVKNLPAMQETRVQSLGREDLLEEEMITHTFLPGEFHGERSLMGYSPRGRKESDTTEWLTHTHTHTVPLLARLTSHLKCSLCSCPNRLVFALGKISDSSLCPYQELRSKRECLLLPSPYLVTVVLQYVSFCSTAK